MDLILRDRLQKSCRLHLVRDFSWISHAGGTTDNILSLPLAQLQELTANQRWLDDGIWIPPMPFPKLQPDARPCYEPIGGCGTGSPCATTSTTSFLAGAGPPVWMPVADLAQSLCST